MKVIKITKHSYELEDGSILPIVPSLTTEMPLAEFQEYYDRACTFIQGSKDTGNVKPDS